MSYRRCDKPTHVASVGLIFDRETREHVLLERKSHPDWLKGQLVGPGGAVEKEDCGPLDCINREIREETFLQPFGFKLFARLHRTTPTHPYLVTYFYRAIMPFHELYDEAHSKVNADRDEPVVLVRVAETRNDICANERYLIHVAHEMIENASYRPTFLDIYEEYKEAHDRFGSGY